jgi:hypothetical protein
MSSLHTSRAHQVVSLLLRNRNITAFSSRRHFSSSPISAHETNNGEIPVIRSLTELRAWRRRAREEKKEVGVVPTVSYDLLVMWLKLMGKVDGSVTSGAFGSGSVEMRIIG